MVSVKKSFSVRLTAFVCGLILFGALLPVAAFSASAKTTAYAAETAEKGYYYDNLTIGSKSYTLGKKFYDALDDLRISGDFKDGKIERTIDDIVTSGELKSWVEDGDTTIPKAFGAARDSFIMDHPELFYIDAYKIMISAGYANGKYTGYIDSGREPNIYRDDAFKNETEVNAAIVKYNAAVKTFADAAQAKTASVSSLYRDDAKLAIAVNEEIAGKVKYDYAVYSDYLENGENSKTTASLAHTAYGALVNRKAVCSGYSFAYKAVMDSLRVPTVVVSGYSTGKERDGSNTGGNVPHSWNYVKLEVAEKAELSDAQTSATETAKAYEWFAFDTTWSSVCSNKNKYSAMDSATASEEHLPVSEISSSKYPLSYPSLSQVEYLQAVDPNSPKIETTVDGFKCVKICKPSGNSYTVIDHVSYNGKNSGDLLESEGLRIASRVYYMDTAGSGEKRWTDWQDLATTAQYVREGHTELGIADESDSTFVIIAYNSEKVQYAVVRDLAPDKDAGEGNFKLENLYYSDAAAVQSHAVYLSDEMVNPVYGTYTPPPYIVASRSKPLSGTDVTINSNMSEPGDSNIMADSKAITVKLVYDEPLHVLDPSKDIGIEVNAKVSSAMQYASVVKYPDGKYVHLTKDEKGVANTLEFRFKPSLMFEHNRVGYTFSFTNVGSAKIVEKKDGNNNLVRTTSDMTPNHAYYVFSRATVACPRVFGDGRLYIDCCAQPTLVDNSDLSATGFEDENGNPTFSEAARSQMMLVVNEVSPNTQNEILNEIDAGNNGIGKDDIKKSQTYDINLQMCGKIAKIPDGSFVRLALGFPEGYGPNDEGVTFKIFHRKHKGGNVYEIEEIPCVVTKFGIVVTVTSFSPYTVVVVPESKATGKTITASIDGKGGTLEGDDRRVHSIDEGGSYTYTLTPSVGYRIYKVTLNGKDVTDKVADNELTVEYADLDKNNELEIKYISDEAAARFTANNIVDPVRIVIPVGADLFGGTPSAPGKSVNVALIVVLVLLCVVLVAAGVVAFIFLYRRRALQTATPSKKSAGVSARQKTSGATTQTKARPTQSAARPVTQSTPRPTTQDVKRPTTQGAARPAAQSATRPTTQNTARPTTQNTARPATQDVKRTTTQSTPRPTTQNTARPTTQSTARPATQDVKRPTTQGATRPTTQSSARPATQDVKRTTTQGAARPATQSSARPMTQNTARPTTQSTPRPKTPPQNDNKK